MNNLIITLERLKDFLGELKTFIKDYFDSRIDKTIDKNSNNPVANSVVSKNRWIGLSTEIESAIASGDIIPGYTEVILTDRGDDTVYTWATIEDIYKMFGLEYKPS